MVVLDGLSDLPCSNLNGKTPLEAANPPNLNKIAKNGVIGRIQVYKPGYVLNSVQAHLALLGYDPAVCYTGRGAFEAIGAGIELEEGDVAFRGSYAIVDKNMILLDRTANHFTDTERKAEMLLEKNATSGEYIFRSTVGYRNVLVLKNASPFVSEVDPEEPGKRIKEAVPLSPDSVAKSTCDRVTQFTLRSYEVLSSAGLGPNIVLLKTPGVKPKIPSFREKWGLSAACVAAVPAIKGLCRAAGFDIIESPGATGWIDSNFIMKAKKAKNALDNHDFVFLHVEATDEISHDKNPRGKAKLIENLDAMFNILGELNDVVLAVLSDHTTSSELGMHHPEPPIIAIKGPNIYSDNLRFTERDAARGRLGTVHSDDLIPILMGYAGKPLKVKTSFR
ncbi:MAG: alkaline phosphatase family protein [Candidatus Korarchaeota archaeon]